ncbi:hypothetical protein NEOC65_002328 [Neochlamydia sp. AcF65]|nr:hypothetical protein [Neochlamydia sp. AcF65]
MCCKIRSPTTNLAGLTGWSIFLQTAYQILLLAASIQSP